MLIKRKLTANLFRINFIPIFLLYFLLQDGSGGGTEGARNTAAEPARVGISPTILLIVAALAILLFVVVVLPFVMNYRREVQGKGK